MANACWAPNWARNLLYVSLALQGGVERTVWSRNEPARTLVARCCDQPEGFLPTAAWVFLATQCGRLHRVDLGKTFLKHVPFLQTVKNWLSNCRLLFRENQTQLIR